VQEGTTTASQRPYFSVIIPNWNGEKHLPACLDALRAQTFRVFEVIVVDNASQDGSLRLLAEKYPDARVVQMAENRFFSGAVNAGVNVARGEVIVLLNNDTEADPHWLEELKKALDEHPEAGMAASKLRLFDRRTVLHSAGDFYRRDGVPGNRGVWEEDAGQYDGSIWTFSACAAAAAYRRYMLDHIGLLDEDFYGYCEDVDLAFRAQLMDYRCLFVPSAIVYHKLSATGGGPIASYYCGRNFINVIVKDMPGKLLRKHWPAIVRSQVGYLLNSLWHIREASARARLRGQFAALRQLRLMLRKRREIQRRKQVSDEYIESILT
jgi:GT2 family glycosyltransferase